MSVDVIFRKSIDTFTVNINGFNNIEIPYKEVFTVPVKRIQKLWCLRIFPSPEILRVDLGYKGLEPTTASYQIKVFNSAKEIWLIKTSSIQQFIPLPGGNYFFPDDSLWPYENLGITTESLRIEVRIELYHPMEQTLRDSIEPFAEGSCELKANIAGLSLSNSLTDVSLVGTNGEAIVHQPIN